MKAYKEMKKSIMKLPEQSKVKKVIDFFTDLSTFKRTFFLALFYVFLFYLPFIFYVLFLGEALSFQGDYLYQFSTIVMDFRDKLYSFDFSTWDFKNTIGYDYFSNFYYIPLDITLLPFFLFPFLSYTKLMFLSFLLKILLGTAAFAYLLKLYKLKHKTILIVAVLYGTADLFFAQNVFASYTGLTFYIPLILIGIEYMFQKKNFLIFSLVMFQVFLFNSYWAWGLTLFMAISLLVRYILEHITFKNIREGKTYKQMGFFFGKSILFFLLGFGLAGFFIIPLLNIINTEPRVAGTTNFFDTLSAIFSSFGNTFNPAIVLKEFFKMLVPNLSLYKGFYYYDTPELYWLTVNHQVIYSSILASFSFFFFVVFPNHIAKNKLSERQYKIFTTLKVVTILATILMLFEVTAQLFSLNSGPYLRWLIFYGVLLIIDFAFIFDFKLFNNKLFASFLVIAIGYLIFSIKYNLDNPQTGGFFEDDQTIAYTMIFAYITILLIVILLDKYMRHELTLLIERIFAIGLIFGITTSQFTTRDANHINYYGKTVNQLIDESEELGDLNLDEYTVMLDYLFMYDQGKENMPDMPYLFNFPVYNSFNTFHSLINPYYRLTPINYTGHKRYYHAMDLPYLYYYYMDPSLFIISNDLENPVQNEFYEPSSKLVNYKEIKDFDTSISIYKKDQTFSIGNGFEYYFDVNNPSKKNFDDMWLNAFYVQDGELLNKLESAGFTKETNPVQVTRKVSYNTGSISSINVEGFGTKYKIPVSITREESDVVILSTNAIYAYSQNQPHKFVFTQDNEGNIDRCNYNFCFVPESGLQGLIINDNKTTIYPYTVDKTLLEEKTNDILKYSTYDVEVKGNTIHSKVDNDKPVIMTYKIGYAEGWDVYVDGQKVEAFPSFTGQLSFMLTDQGTHEIKLEYHTPGLKTGAFVTIGSIVIFGTLVYYKYPRRKKDKEVKNA